MANFGIQNLPSDKNPISAAQDEIEPQSKFDKLTNQKTVEDKQIQKMQSEEKVIMKLLEKADTAKPAQAAVSSTAKEVDQKSGSKSTNVFSGVSEDIHREIKKKEAYRVAGADSGSMKEVDDHKDKDDTDPRKEKKHREFMFDLMALLYRLGLIKKKK